MNQLERPCVPVVASETFGASKRGGGKYRSFPTSATVRSFRPPACSVRASMAYKIIIRLTFLASAPVRSRRTLPAAAMPDNNCMCDAFRITLSVMRAFMSIRHCAERSARHIARVLCQYPLRRIGLWCSPLRTAPAQFRGTQFNLERAFHCIDRNAVSVPK